MFLHNITRERMKLRFRMLYVKENVSVYAKF